jgi:hypothetical protein
MPDRSDANPIITPDETAAKRRHAAALCAWAKVDAADDEAPQQLAERQRDIDTRHAIADLDDRWGPDRSDCGGWTASGPPCGGCYRCVLDQTLHYLPDQQTYLARAQRVVDLLRNPPADTAKNGDER